MKVSYFAFAFAAVAALSGLGALVETQGGNAVVTAVGWFASGAFTSAAFALWSWSRDWE